MEVLLGIAIFALFVSAVGYVLLYGQESTIMSGDRIRAVQFTERSLEGARSMRGASFASITAGQHGLWVNGTTKQWAFTGSEVIMSGGYITSLTVMSVAPDWVRLSALTKWKHGYNRSGAVLITSELTDWRTTRNIGNWSSITLDGSYTDGGTPQFIDIAIYSGSYVFVGARSTAGIYVFNTVDTTSPTRINSSFSLGYGVHDMVILDSFLIVATDDSSAEIKVYDISSPATFSAANLVASMNVQGSTRVRSLAVSGDMLYAGTTASTGIGDDEFYTYRVATNGTLTLLDTINDDTSGIQMIAISGTAAYLASSMDTSELRVVNVESGSSIISLDGYNLSDRTLDGMSVAVSGTSALIGTMRGTSIDELVLFDLESGGVPSPPPGPWYHEGSGSIVAIDMDPTRCFAFFAAESSPKALQIINLRNKSTLAEFTSYNSTTGPGRAILYDLPRDRLFLTTDRALLIFRPGASTGTCP